MATDEFVQPLAADAALGKVPAGLPSRLLVGLFEDTGGTWMKNSNAAWDVRYRYVTKGWVNNWGWGAADGGWALGYLNESQSQGYVPALQYYQIFAEPGGGEAQTLQKVQNADTMRSYFNDFKILMQRVKDYGKPAYVLLEADAFGFLEQQSGHNPNAAAAIASTGIPELAGLPNTVAGWGLAFLQLRKAVGANNAILGIHISGWASGKDVAYSSAGDPLTPEVDKVYNFLKPAGLGPNVTGTEYDVLVGDPLDRDADFYTAMSGQNRWWDASDGASINSQSFNRYAEFLKQWNQKSGKRWVLWQIPLGNSAHRNVWNNGAPGEGYKDNRTEYFFGPSGATHRTKFADAGVIALLFGAGASGNSSYSNDTYTDGKLFMQSRAGAFLNAGGLAINDGRGGSTTPPGSGGSTGAGGTTGSGGTSGSGGTTGTGGTPPRGDTARFGFEGTTQGWSASGANLSGVSSSADLAFAGSRSLKVTITGSGSGSAKVSAPNVPAGATVSFRVYLTQNAQVSSVQPYLLQGAAGGWAWTGAWRAASTLQRNAWNAITVRVPAGAASLAELGIEFTTTGAGTVYVDSVNW